MLGNLARSVLRGEGSRDAPALPDLISKPQPESTMWTSLPFILAAYFFNSCYFEKVCRQIEPP